MADSPKQLALRYREISLTVQASSDEFQLLFEILASPEVAPNVFGQLNLRAPDSFRDVFRHWVEKEFGYHFLVRHDRLGIIGFVFEYARRVEDGHTKASIILDPKFVNLGHGAIAMALFLNWLFNAVRVDGVFLEVFGYNERVLSALRSLRRYMGNPLEEIVTPRSRHWGGAIWAMHKFRIYRSEWPAIISGALR